MEQLKVDPTDPSSDLSYRQRVLLYLNIALREHNAWVPMRELRAAIPFKNPAHFCAQVAYMERRGEIRIDRSQGKQKRRFARLTPGEDELWRTQITLALEGYDIWKNGIFWDAP